MKKLNITTLLFTSLVLINCGGSDKEIVSESKHNDSLVSEQKIDSVVKAKVEIPVFMAEFKEGQFKQSDCKNYSKMRSQKGKSTTIYFDNQSKRDLKLFWIDYKGKKVFYSKIKSGKGFKQQTFVNHPWLIKDANDGTCLVIIKALRGGKTDTVTFRN